MAGKHRKPAPPRRLRLPDPYVLLAVLAVVGLVLIGTATPEPAIADTSLYVEADATVEPPPTFRCAPLDVETPHALPAPVARTVAKAEAPVKKLKKSTTRAADTRRVIGRSP